LIKAGRARGGGKSGKEKSGGNAHTCHDGGVKGRADRGREGGGEKEGGAGGRWCQNEKIPFHNLEAGMGKKKRSVGKKRYLLMIEKGWGRERSSLSLKKDWKGGEGGGRGQEEQTGGGRSVDQDLGKGRKVEKKRGGKGKTQCLRVQ